MRHLTLESVQKPVPAIGQGCGGGIMRDSADVARRAEALREGIDRGLTLLDTAEAYHGGLSEQAVGQAAKGQRDRVFIASKVSPEHLRPSDLIAAAERSLRRLQTDYLDLYQIHWSNPKVPIAETMGALAGLMAAGKVRQVGVCNFSAKEIAAAAAAFRPLRLFSLQAEYNLFDRSAEESLFPHWQAPGRIFLAYSPLEQGSLAGGEAQRLKLQAVAARYRATAAQLALAWIVSHPGVVAIPKASRPEHIRENAGAADLLLSEADRKLIGETLACRPRAVPVNRIRVVLDGQENRPAYRSVAEALANGLGLVPSPRELAEDILGGEFLKPVRVRPAQDGSGGHDYDLIEGRLRYWAWVIAFNGERPINVLVREN
jgi:aryl-alcohol dehydrogenase-like predicted oxidoreductase